MVRADEEEKDEDVAIANYTRFSSECRKRKKKGLRDLSNEGAR